MYKPFPVFYQKWMTSCAAWAVIIFLTGTVRDCQQLATALIDVSHQVAYLQINNVAPVS